MKPIDDLHTHLFNARYVPLASIIKSRADFVPNWLAQALQIIVCFLTAGDEYAENPSDEELEQELGRKSDVSEAYASTIVERCRKRLEYQIAVYDETKNGEDGDVLFEVLEALESVKAYHEEGSVLNVEQMAVFQFPGRGILKEEVSGRTYRAAHVFDERYQKALIKVLEEMDKAVGSPIEELGSFLRFIWVMMFSEAKLLERLEKDYSDSAGGSNPVDLYVHYMMDMEYAYRRQLFMTRKPCYRFKSEQIDRAGDLVRRSEGRVVGFSAFDPSRNGWRKTIKRALRNGNVGVKFYPPLGYRAHSNTCEGSIRDDCGDIEDRVNAFFSYCREERIPVFAHCTPKGFYAYPGMGLNAAPVYWRSALEGGHADLIFCFGHSGGGSEEVKYWRRSGSNEPQQDCSENDPDCEEVEEEFYGWFDHESKWESDKCYARQVIWLCEEYEHVYCDFGYLTELLDGTEDQKTCFMERLRKILKEGTGNPNAKYKLAEKIIYGSDWHMPAMLGQTGEYLKAFQNVFSYEDLREYAPGFFGVNALRYLRLDRYIERHEKHNQGFLTAKAIKRLRGLHAFA